MALKVIKSNEQIEVTTLCICIFSEPGLGKSTLAFTASKPILLDFDKGAHRAGNRKDIVPIESWSDLSRMEASDFDGYDTVIIDTAGRALDALTLHIIKEFPKQGYNGALNQKGWGTLKSQFVAFLNLIRSYGKDIVLIAHSVEERKADDLIIRLDVQGGSKGEIYKSADVMGRLSMENNQRILSFNPTDAQFGKNPGQLPIVKLPDISSTDWNDDALAKVFSKTKDKLNSLSEAQSAELKRMAALKADFEAMETADEFNIVKESMAEAEAAPKDKALLVSIATSKGLVYNKDERLFEAQAEPEAESVV